MYKNRLTFYFHSANIYIDTYQIKLFRGNKNGIYRTCTKYL